MNFKFYSSTIVEFYFKEAINAMVVSSVTLVLVSHVLTKTNVRDEFVTSLKILIASILKFGLHVKGIPGDSTYLVTVRFVDTIKISGRVAQCYRALS